MNLSASESFRTSDIETGRMAGMRTVLVRTGFGGGDGEFSARPDVTAEDLLDAAERILEIERK